MAASGVDRRWKWAGETRVMSLDCQGMLDAGETLSSVTSVTGSPSGLTISGAAVTGAERTINGATVPIGEAITCTISGGTAGTTYTIVATLVTAASQTITPTVYLDVR